MQQRDVVIIGGGPAGRVIVHALHSQNSDMSVTLIKNEQINVNRCAVPYGIPPDKPIENFQIPNKLVTDYGAELVVDHAVKIDTQQKQVHTRKGQKYGYKHLVFATGSRPLLPPIPGVELSGVTAVRSLKDLDALRRFAAEGQKAVIVGGGYIGVEVAAVLRQMGLEVYERDNRRLIGGSVMRKGPGAAQNVDFISLAIQMGATLEDLLSYQYATHPELAAKPSDNTYVFAARGAMANVNPV